MQLHSEKEIKETIVHSKVKSSNVKSIKERRVSIPDEAVLVAEKVNPLESVRCLECHCVGTVIKTAEGAVLNPNTVKKTLLELDGGVFIPSIRKTKSGFLNAIENAKEDDYEP